MFPDTHFQKGCQALKQAAQGSGGINNPRAGVKSHVEVAFLGTWFRGGLGSTGWTGSCRVFPNEQLHD